MKLVPGYEAYAVSRDGKVWTRWNRGGKRRYMTNVWREKKQDADEKDHLHVQLFPEHGKPRRFPVHRLVLKLYVGDPPSGTEACHNDGNPWNNAVNNLRWDTRQSNWADRKSHGNGCEGSKNTCSKLTERDAKKIRKMRSSGKTLKLIAEAYDVSIATIHNIVVRNSWKHV